MVSSSVLLGASIDYYNSSYKQLVQLHPDIDEYRLYYAQVCSLVIDLMRFTLFLSPCIKHVSIKKL